MRTGPFTCENFSAGDAQNHGPIHACFVCCEPFACLAKLILHGRVQNARLYLTANSKGGLIMTGLLVKAARRLGYRSICTITCICTLMNMIGGWRGSTEI